MGSAVRRVCVVAAVGRAAGVGSTDAGAEIAASARRRVAFSEVSCLVCAGVGGRAAVSSGVGDGRPLAAADTA